MKYRTVNEFGHFSFEEAVIDEICIMDGSVSFELENVKILPDNSCNRDIRVMRSNDIVMKIREVTSVKLVKIGYKLYDADGNFQQSFEDEELPKEKYKNILDELRGSMIFSFSKENSKYTVCVDTEEESYDIIIEGAQDIMEWDRFLNL